LAAPSGAVNSIDPASTFWWNLVSVTHDGLVGYKRVGGSDGGTLVPDLAGALPTPTSHGKTYTFRLRPGIKFADGREVKASAVRSTFERLFRATGPGANLADYYAGIVGVPACVKQPKQCDLSQGVVTDNDTGTVTIKLRAPDPELLYKLALPYAYVVPSGTPATGDRPVPGTGPYRIAQYEPKRRVRLVRNRHFREWSKAAQPEGFPDEIVIEMAGTRDANLTAVQRGRADWTGCCPPNLFQDVRTRYAAQLHLSPGLFTLALRLNTARPPFDDVRARRAVAYAFDRGRLADTEGGRDAVTCQLLPPNVAAYDRYCPYTVGPKQGVWTGPDLDRARKLVADSGTQGMRVDVLGQTQGTDFGTITTILDRTLREIGYRTSLRRVPGDFYRYFDAYKTGAGRFEAAIMGWIADYPAPSNFMTGMLECSGNPYACDPNVERKLRETLELQSRSPSAANEAWARLEREVVDNAIVVPVINPTSIDFVSKRLGNYQSHPLFGMLISQVWVR
jgi:peptide/nickel transport system substrate-binding protein